MTKNLGLLFECSPNFGRLERWYLAAVKMNERSFIFYFALIHRFDVSQVDVMSGGRVASLFQEFVSKMGNSALPERTAPSGAANKKQVSREAKQQQILDATVRCVRLKGFHATSMTDIAREAKVSVGVIYLYFENKEAILEAIAAEDLAEMRAKLAEFAEFDREDLLDKVIDGLDFALSRQFDRSRGALALEMVVEAARNPKVEQIMQEIDAQGRELSRHLMSNLRPDSADVTSMDAKGEILMALIDGMMIRGVLNPESNRKDVHETFKNVFRMILTL